jgi:hypothetical protein
VKTGPFKNAHKREGGDVKRGASESARARFKRQHVKNSMSLLFAFLSVCSVSLLYSCTQPNNRRTTRPPSLLLSPQLILVGLFFGAVKQTQRGRGDIPPRFAHHRWWRGWGERIQRHPSRFASREGLAIDIENGLNKSRAPEVH